MTVLDRIFSLALLTFPPDLRARYGSEMLAAYRAERQAVLHEFGVASTLKFSVRAWGDAVLSGLRARYWNGKRRSRDGTMAFFDVGSDIRYAARSLARSPGFTFIALTMLALGIGANTAIFSVVDAVLLQPLPYPDAEQLVTVLESKTDHARSLVSISYPNFFDLHEQNEVFESVGAYTDQSMNLTGEGPPEQIQAGRITSGFLPALGMSPIIGRGILSEEDDAGQVPTVALLSVGAWENRYGSDPDILGKSVNLDGVPLTVVGVLPTDDNWLGDVEFWVPLIIDPARDRSDHRLVGVGRIREGLTLEGARAGLEPLGQQLASLYPQDNPGMGWTLIPSSEWGASPELRRGLLILLGAVGVLLLIACVNLANLLLARAVSRSRDLAICAALGASRGRIARRVWSEASLLCLGGAGLGLLVAVWGVDALMGLQPDGISGVQDVELNPWVLAFTGGVALSASVLSGLLPALQKPSGGLASALREGGRSLSGSRTQQRIRTLLVAAETALSLVLLVGAGLLIRSLGEVRNLDQGYEVERRVTFEVGLPDSYGSREETSGFINGYLDRVRAIPGVASAGAVSIRPIRGGSTSMDILPQGVTAESFGGVASADWRLITEGYFEAMGVEMVRGRDLTLQDDPAQWPIVVSESLANTLWPGEDPIGKQADLWNEGERIGTVMGVVGDMRERGPESGPTGAVYLSYELAPWSPVHFVVESRSEPETLVPLLQDLLVQMDPTLPLARVETLDDMVSSATAQRRFQAILLAIFAGVALVLASLGIYGVINYTVSQRTSEIGVRVALGASSPSVLKGVIRDGMIPVIWGVAIGIPSALALSRLMDSLLFGVRGYDTLTYAAVSGILLVMALAACWQPARRALRVSPVEALKAE
jgi:putative ABC transport system permease protein